MKGIGQPNLAAPGNSHRYLRGVAPSGEHLLSGSPVKGMGDFGYLGYPTYARNCLTKRHTSGYHERRGFPPLQAIDS